MFSAQVIVLLAVAAGGLVAGRWLGLPAVVAYLVAGVLAGPSGFGWVSPSPAIEGLAELGVALLLFGVGIEFSLERIRRILPRMVVSGGLQVGLTIAATTVLLGWLGLDRTTALFAGFLVSLSSTAIVFKIYAEEGELDAPQGQAAAGILLFQDLALVPMMMLVPVLARPAGHGVGLAAAAALLKAAAAVGALLFLARAVLPRGLELAARARTPEIFPLVALVSAFGTALCAVRVGLSLPIGTFLAGLALSGSPYAHQVFAEILPLRDAFVAVFFTSIGMFLEPSLLAAAPAVLGVMVGAVLLKAVVTGTIVGWLWRSRALALLAGLGLAQVGEFSFVLGREGLAAGVVDERFIQAFLGAAILTMGATPFLMRAARRLALLGAATATPAAAGTLADHVIVIGYGSTGKALVRGLCETGIPFAALDMDPAVIEAAAKEGVEVHFGDASRRAVLEELGASRARAAVVALGDPGATRRVVSLLRQMNSHLRILVHARHVDEIEELERIGADDVVPSEFETSIEILVRLLGHLGVPRHVVRLQEELIRGERYRPLRGPGIAEDLLAETRRLIAGGILERARVMEGSEACGRTLAELNLRRRTGASVLSIVRNDRPLPNPDGPTRLEAGDLLVLFGSHAAIDRAFDLLEPREGPGARERRRGGAAESGVTGS